MHRGRTLVLLGSIVAAGALLLPVVDLTGLGPVDGIEGDAWPAVALVGPAALTAVLGDRRERPGPTATVIAIVAGVAALGFSIVKWLDASAAVSEAGGSLGVGAWLLPGALLLVVAGLLLGSSRRIG